MISLALLVMLADGVLTVPPSEWRALEVTAQRNGTVLDCSFRVLEGSRVQVMLLDRREAERFHRGRNAWPLHSTGFEEAGRFRRHLSDAGRYVLLIDNRIEHRRPAQVHLRMELLDPNAWEVRTLAPERRRMVVALSLAFFGAVILFSARQYLKQQS